MKGIVFTLEALITFVFFLIIIVGTTILVQPSQQTIPISEYVFLNDIYQVLELEYHDDLVIFSISGIPTSNLSKFISFLEANTGKKIFIKYYSQFPNCEPEIQTKRLFTFPNLSVEKGIVDVNYFHMLTIGICKK